MIDQLIALGPYQWAGLVFGVLYIITAIKENPICWVFGIISCGSIAIEHFTKTKLYQDGALQLFYIAMSFYGLYKWRIGQEESKTEIQSLSIKQWLLIFVIGLPCSFIFAFLVDNYTDGVFPLMDALTTVFSLIATVLLIYKYYENWLLWIVIDLIYIYLYFDRAAPLFSVLYLIFTIMAIEGLRSWRKKILI